MTVNQILIQTSDNQTTLIWRSDSQPDIDSDKSQVFRQVPTKESDKCSALVNGYLRNLGCDGIELPLSLHMIYYDTHQIEITFEEIETHYIPDLISTSPNTNLQKY